MFSNFPPTCSPVWKISSALKCRLPNSFIRSTDHVIHCACDVMSLNIFLSNCLAVCTQKCLALIKKVLSSFTALEFVALHRKYLGKPSTISFYFTPNVLWCFQVPMKEAECNHSTTNFAYLHKIQLTLSNKSALSLFFRFIVFHEIWFHGLL